MNKQTIKEELCNRDYSEPSKAVSVFYHVLSTVLSKKYNCQYQIIDDINKEEGPAFVIFNHLSRFDHFFLEQLLYPKRFNILAASNEFYRGGQYFLFKIQKCIPKMNFTSDINAMKAIQKSVKRGATILFAPEGMTPMDGKNHPVAPGTGHLLKHYGIPVYQAELRGQFLIASKVCLDERLGGKCYATLRKLYTPEDLKQMSDEEIEADLNNLMRHDEYAWQKEKHFRFDMKGQSCKNLEDLCFMCPKCGSYFSMKNEGNRLYCTQCGNGTEMDDYYDFHPFEGSIIPETPSTWCDMERKDIIRAIRKDPNYTFSMKVKLGKLPDYKPTKGNATSVLCGEGIFSVDHNGVHFRGTKDGAPFEFDRNYKHLFTILSALDFKFFDLYVDSDFYDFFPEEGEEGKIGYLQLLIEEMHRLHVNLLKNFPWNESMYQ